MSALHGCLRRWAVVIVLGCAVLGTSGCGYLKNVRDEMEIQLAELEVVRRVGGGDKHLRRLLVDAIFTRDFPVVQMCLFISSSLFIFTNLFVDVLYAYIDPRIRYD